MDGWTIPQWLASGSAPQWGLLVVVLLGLLRWSLPWRKLTIDEGTQIRSELREEVKKLRAEHTKCQEELKDAKAKIGVLRDEVNDLEEKIIGQRRQHVQEQISLVAAIIASVPDPKLRTLLTTLESVRHNLPARIMEDLKKGADGERA